MKIADYKDAMEFFKNSRQEESNGKWKEFVEKSRFDDMLQEPRTMAQGPRMGLKPGGIVEPGVEYYGKFTEAEKKANIKTWMDNTGSTLEDYNKKSSWNKSFIKSSTESTVSVLESCLLNQFLNCLVSLLSLPFQYSAVCFMPVVLPVLTKPLIADDFLL